MKCPDCGAKISAKHYDADFEWYECPKCEGAFTVKEIEEARNAEPPRNKKGNSGRKASGSGSKKRSNAGRANGKAPTGDAEIRDSIKRVQAKGKKRRTEVQEDEEALAKHEAEMLKPRESTEPKATRHRDEMDSRAVINIWGDEIQDVYHELGTELDEVNAQDKALIIWREIHHLQGVSAREQEVPHAACEDHS